MFSLITVSKPRHARHNSQHIVGPAEDEQASVSRDVELKSVVLSEGVSEVDREDGAIDTGQVSGTAGLVVFRGDSEGVDVDTISRGTGVVVVRLVVVEVATFLDIEAVVAVKLDLGGGNGVTLTIKSQTVVAGLGDSDILVDSVSGRVSRSVVDIEVLNRDGQVSQAQSVGDLNGLDGNRVGGTVRVRDNNVSVLDHVRQLNTVVVSEQREVQGREQSVVSVDTDVGLVDVIDALTVGEASDVVVSELNSDTLAIVESRVVDLRAQVDILAVDRTGVRGQTVGVDEDATLRQVSGGVVRSVRQPEVVVVSVGKELTAATRERVSVGLTAESTDLHGPDELLGRVVEVELVLLVVALRVGVDLHILLRVLNLLNKVLVSELGVLATLTRLKVDIVDHDTGITELEVAQVRSRSTSPAHQLGGLLELELDADLVVLQGNQGQGQTVVAAEPELEGHVQDVLRQQDFVGVVEELLTTQGSHLRDVTDEGSVTALSRLVVRQLPQDVEPRTEVLVDSHATDLNLNLLKESMSKTSHPGNLLSSRSENIRSDGRHADAQSRLGSEISLSQHLDRVSAAGAGRVDGELDGLHREVSVSSVDHLEVSNLRVTGQVNILGTVSDK